MYPSAKALARPEVKGFMDYILANQQAIADASKIVPLTDEQADQGQGRADQGRELSSTRVSTANPAAARDAQDSGPGRRAASQGRGRDPRRCSSSPRCCRS